MDMKWYILVAVVSLGICLAGIIYHLLRLIRAGRLIDYATPAGHTKPAIAYSFTGAMSPAKKESAFLHLPTYTAGILYHLGTFLAIALFFLILPGVKFPVVAGYVLAGLLLISFGCGVGMLMKRIGKKGLRDLSNPDDYLSNFLVTLFQLVSAGMLVFPWMAAWYFLTASLLFLVFPFSKLKHAVYFFAARYQLGLFYGRRGVWPPRNTIKN